MTTKTLKTTDELIAIWSIKHDGTCVVCGARPTGKWAYHARLDIFVCLSHDITNIRGEDIYEHAMVFGAN